MEKEMMSDSSERDISQTVMEVKEEKSEHMESAANNDNVLDNLPAATISQSALKLRFPGSTKNFTGKQYNTDDLGAVLVSDYTQPPARPIAPPRQVLRHQNHNSESHNNSNNQ